MLPGRVGALRFVRQDRERRLEAVREVAGLGDRAPHRPFAMVEQRVEVVDERLDFARIAPLDSPIAPVAHRRELVAQLVERRQAAAHHATSPPAMHDDGDDHDQRESCGRRH